MKKWIMMAVANWLRKPENQQKAKSAWNNFRNRNASKQTTQPSPPPSRDTSKQRSHHNIDDQP